jgi:hypothetical protein
MTTGDFPLKRSRTLAQFWMPSAANHPVTGTLEVEGSEIRLEVSPGLTPMHSFESVGPGNWSVRAMDDPTDMVVLGSIPLRPQLVTVWDAYTTSRHAMGLPTPLGDEGPNAHEMMATWLIVGAHHPDPNTRLYAVRPDVTNLSEWAWMPALATTIYPDDRLKLDWHLDLRGHSIDASLVGTRGYITLGPGASHRPPDIRGLHVTTYSRLEIELTDGWTMNEVVEHALSPLTSLMTILSGKPSVVRSLDVWAGEKWCTAHGYLIDPNGSESAGELLFTQPEVGLDFLASWLDLHRRCTPVPQILAAVVRNEFPTVEAEALSLATAVEALHRGLFPTARRFSTDEIDQSLAAMATSDMPTSVNDTLSSALRQYWHEYSYPQRVRELAEPVAAAVPSCIGKLGRWKNAVVEQRISLAHGMEQGGLGRELILRMSTLNRSVRWMLTLRLLLLAGASPKLLAEATDRSERFNEDIAQCRKHWPRVFGN